MKPQGSGWKRNNIKDSDLKPPKNEKNNKYLKPPKNEKKTTSIWNHLKM